MFNNCADVKIVIYRNYNYEKIFSKLVDIMQIIIYLDFSLKVYEFLQLKNHLERFSCLAFLEGWQHLFFFYITAIWRPTDI